MQNGICNAEEARKLIDNGWAIVMFLDGIKSYTAIAFRQGESADQAVNDWQDEDHEDMVFGGKYRYAACGFTIADTLESLTEKVLFCRLPE